MKKILSVLLAALMLASVACVWVSAGTYYDEGTILYEDDFEDGKDETFWGGTGTFVFEDGTMNGFDDSKIGQSRYIWDDRYSDSLSTTSDWPCQKEFTEWIDVKVDESGVETLFCAGFWIQDGGNAIRGFESDRTIYSILYVAYDEGELVDKPVLDDEGQPQYDDDGNVILAPQPHTSYAVLQSNTERREKANPEGAYPGADYPNHVYGKLDIEGDPGFNIDGEAIKLGVRFGHGNITAYANGKIVGSYDFETIGTAYTPILVQNTGCYVEFDNYGLGKYEHNVKKSTRNDSYALYEGAVTVMDGETVAGTVNAAEDDELTVTAPKVAGRKFVRWESVSIGGVEVKDVAKTELLYGIKIGSLEDEKFTITMPDADVVLKAVYEDAADEFIPGDANNDGKVNAKDVTAIMKYIVGVTAKDFNESAADFDANGKINAKDVGAVMKYIVLNA